MKVLALRDFFGHRNAEVRHACQGRDYTRLDRLSQTSLTVCPSYFLQDLNAPVESQVRAAALLTTELWKYLADTYGVGLDGCDWLKRQARVWIRCFHSLSKLCWDMILHITLT